MSKRTMRIARRDARKRALKRAGLEVHVESGIESPRLKDLPFWAWTRRNRRGGR